MGEVERAAWQLRGDGVAELEADVGKLGAGAGGVVEHVDVAVETDDLAGRADERGQLGQDADGTAPMSMARPPAGTSSRCSSQPASSSINAAWATTTPPFALAVTEQTRVVRSCC